jgi:chorismate synthase
MSLRFLTAGESHGPGLTAILEGLPAGLPLDEDLLAADLLRRQQGYGAGPRMKLESDTPASPAACWRQNHRRALALWIENQDHARWLGKDVPGYTVPRPGHADLAGVVKYGLDDIRPALERASARETAARVAAGAACRALLAQFDIRVGGYVAAIGAVEADLSAIPLEDRAARARLNEVHCPDPQAAAAMQARIRQVMQERDTLGGVLEVIALGLPAGLGSYVQWDRAWTLNWPPR